MSWDVSLVEHGVEIYEANYTHNTNGAIRSTGVVWDSSISGMTAAQLHKHLEPFLTAAVKRPRDFDKFDPGNGWGTVTKGKDSLVIVLLNLAVACARHPHATVEASF